jgi:hypothetical protein
MEDFSEPFARGIMEENITIMAVEQKSYNCQGITEMQVIQMLRGDADASMLDRYTQFTPDQGDRNI